MAGEIKRMIDTIIEQRAKGSKILEGVVKTKLILKGVDPKNYTNDSPDDQDVINRLYAVMMEQK